MIKLTNLNKFYNKNKTNEIHVINDVTLDFPTSGLVVILGESGSGKTTLLNVIGGLDKVQSGSIVFDEEQITKYHSKKWDKIRNDRIGYIFQNYNLLTDLTVYDNIEIVLRMAGIVDEEEIEKRINYILESIGMYHYRKRRASALSGGQQQRVAIARALAKNPEVIIADEPTGNLDSKNTIDIMNIIKKISRTKLVVLVTHEKDIANFYADRIIKIKDGKITDDIVNSSTKDLAVKQDQIIYLKDLYKSDVAAGDVNVITYSDKEDEPLKDIDVKLIYRNNTLYLAIDSDQVKRIKYLDKDTEIKLLDEHYKAIKREDTDDIEYDFENVIKKVERSKNRSVISLKDSFRYAFRKIGNLSRGGKALYFVLAVIGALVSLSIGFLGQIYKIDEAEFMQSSKNYIYVSTDQLNYQEYKDLLNQPFIEEVNMYTGKGNQYLVNESYYQINDQRAFRAHVSDIDLITPNDIIYGSYPTNEYEVVVDKMAADQIITDNSSRGILTYDDIIHSSINKSIYGNYYYDSVGNGNIQFKIVGISDDNSPTVWASKLFYLFYTAEGASPLIDYHLLDNFSLTSGRMPENDNEVIYVGSVEGAPQQIGLYDQTFTVVGVYEDKEINGMSYGTTVLATSPDYLEQILYQYKMANNPSFLVYTTDKQKTLDYFDNLGIYAKDNYQESRANFRAQSLTRSAGILTLAFVGLAISSVSFYLIIRSSLISRIYEVSVYRALGATKNDIRKMFIIEILLITTISSLIGYLGISYILVRLQNEVSRFIEVIDLPIINVILGAIGIYIINTLSGLLPVNLLLRKTPSEIFSKFDL